MTLDEYMKKQGLTDQQFGDRIDRSALQIFKYRHGKAMPPKQTMLKIVEVTDSEVPIESFYKKPSAEVGEKQDLTT